MPLLKLNRLGSFRGASLLLDLSHRFDRVLGVLVVDSDILDTAILLLISNELATLINVLGLRQGLPMDRKPLLRLYLPVLSTSRHS